MKKIGLILGSNLPSRICPEIGNWVHNNLDSSDYETEVLDLSQINLPFLDETEIPAKQQYQKDHSKEWSQKIKSLDAVIFLYPQYNWGYPAVLKNAIDYLASEWRDKKVSFISYGSHGGLQAQIALDLVAVGLKMAKLSTNPLININADMFTDDHQLISGQLDRQKYKIALLKTELESII
ncbi:MAG: NAD(P)H-dependent oxidoreductase [Apilactobacillus sp.]|uniref:NADPH-dependent FMN reductase n=1 Tax=Apilactobacillus sp. TaxID=2767901 RepID=UPI0025E97197|nr:NAD(P)H-dependent oxidoreductase [Apilactobacillus sp.]MCT6822501.1 NAD(P)H-dependent oxidoreductase [Apilactobacillus sp.]